MIVLEALLFGLTLAFMLVGLAGIIVPLLPGMLLVWLSLLVYALVDGFTAVDGLTFAVLSIIALVAGTADLWMSVLGARKGGAAKRALLYGLVGGLIGFLALGSLIPVVGSLFGGVIGYALGILLGQYHKYGNWEIAVKASVGGLAGWGLAAAVELGGAILVMAVFVWQVLSYQP
ncbi:MAG: DUF456 domain-containing protein [Candidatus Promineifilaceae bacterium]|nr:DUF456 domain-containing protein [Candidatus Promineifilaceae bacterium]